MTINLTKEQKEKWMRLIDNARFKSANVGRASPVPTAWIRASTRKDVAILKNEIGSGKVKTKGSQSFLVLGPNSLRELIPLIKNGLRINYDVVELVSEWLLLLDNNVSARNKAAVQASRQSIDNLKISLINMNSDKNSNSISPVPNYDVGILRTELSINSKVPKEVRTPFQEETIISIMKKIALIDPTGPEAKLLKEIEDAKYDKTI